MSSCAASTRRGDRQHRRDARTGGDQHVPAGRVEVGRERAARAPAPRARRRRAPRAPASPTARHRAPRARRCAAHDRPGRRSSRSGVPRRGVIVSDCPGANANIVAQVVGHREGDGGRVVGEGVDPGDGERMEVRPHQISFTYSNGSRQCVAPVQRLAGGPAEARGLRRGAGEPHRGQATRAARSQGERDRAGAARRGVRRRDAGLGQLARARRVGDPVAAPRGASCVRTWTSRSPACAAGA